MIGKIILVIFYVFFPMLILYLCRKIPMINKLGAVVIAYAVGIIVGNISVLPPESESVQNILTIITVPVAIPLLLFSANIRSWFRMAGKTFLSLVAALIGVVVVVASGYLLFRTDSLQDMWKISGMLVGVYTGGTPNLASLKMMLDVNPDIYIITHTYDMILSSIYLLFLITIGRAFFSWFLSPYPEGQHGNSLKMSQLDGQDPYYGIFRKGTVIPLLKAFLISVAIFGIGGGMSLLFPENAQMVFVILVITTLGILMSLIPSINRIEKTFELGNYFILIFSLVVASMADISDFSGAAPNLFYYISYVVFGGLLIHILLSAFMKVDSDTVMVTSTALVCSPPFVPVIASAIKNREVIISGLTVGILGYAIGNYLGYITAQLLKVL
ncbi:MAG: DUF819 family protein [Bacteroidales bacterium]